MKEDTQWRLRDIEGKEYIIIDSKKVDLQEELNKTIVKQQEEIEKLKKEKSILEKSLKLIWKKNIKINYEELDKANKIIEKEVINSE